MLGNSWTASFLFRPDLGCHVAGTFNQIRRSGALVPAPAARRRGHRRWAPLMLPTMSPGQGSEQSVVPGRLHSGLAAFDAELAVDRLAVGLDGVE